MPPTPAPPLRFTLVFEVGIEGLEDPDPVRLEIAAGEVPLVRYETDDPDAIGFRLDRDAFHELLDVFSSALGRREPETDEERALLADFEARLLVDHPERDG